MGKGDLWIEAGGSLWGLKPRFEPDDERDTAECANDVEISLS